MAEKIIGVYKITNTITGDFYIGSSKNVKHRWSVHKCPYTWNKCKNNPLYLDMKKYGVDKFDFQILAEVEIGKLKETEQQFIEKLKPTYNSIRASGWDVEKYKKTKKEYNKEYLKKYYSQPCYYNGGIITLTALVTRFRRAGVAHPTLEAKKYLLTNHKVK